MKATVLGGGIVGLWTADVLSRAGHQVQVLANTHGSHTGSAAASAVLVPFFPGDPNSETFARSTRWATETIGHMESLDPQREFMEPIVCYEFGLDRLLEDDFPVEKLEHIKFSQFDIIQLDRVVDGNDFAVRFNCYLCNAFEYMDWLREFLIFRGVGFTTGTITSLEDVKAIDGDIIFNCLGYQTVFPDPELYPAFGQSFFIPAANDDGPYFGIGAGHHVLFRQRRGYYSGSWYMHHWGFRVPQVDLYQQSLSWLRGPFRELCTSVGIEPPPVNLEDIIRVNTGIRPFRPSGPRVELDQIGSRTLVHNYGHGAHGWTIGYGSALEAVALANLA